MHTVARRYGQCRTVVVDMRAGRVMLAVAAALVRGCESSRAYSSPTQEGLLSALTVHRLFVGGLRLLSAACLYSASWGNGFGCQQHRRWGSRQSICTSLCTLSTPMQG